MEKEFKRLQLDLGESVDIQTGNMRQNIGETLKDCTERFESSITNLNGAFDNLSALFKSKVTKIKVTIAENFA